MKLPSEGYTYTNSVCFYCRTMSQSIGDNIQLTSAEFLWILNDLRASPLPMFSQEIADYAGDLDFFVNPTTLRNLQGMYLRLHRNFFIVSYLIHSIYLLIIFTAKKSLASLIECRCCSPNIVWRAGRNDKWEYISFTNGGSPYPWRLQWWALFVRMIFVVIVLT